LCKSKGWLQQALLKVETVTIAVNLRMLTEG